MPRPYEPGDKVWFVRRTIVPHDPVFVEDPEDLDPTEPATYDEREEWKRGLLVEVDDNVATIAVGADEFTVAEDFVVRSNPRAYRRIPTSWLTNDETKTLAEQYPDLWRKRHD